MNITVCTLWLVSCKGRGMKWSWRMFKLKQTDEAVIRDRFDRTCCKAPDHDFQFFRLYFRTVCCDKLYMLWLLPFPSDHCHLTYYHSLLSNFCMCFAAWMHRFFEKPRSHLKILGAWKVTWSKFSITDPQILGATIQNLVAWATWCLGFLCCWFSVTSRSAQIQGVSSSGWLSLVWWHLIFEGP